MQAIILASGLGKRLRPLTDTIPKPLLPVGGQPILLRTLKSLPAAIQEIVVVVGHLAHLVEQVAGTHYNGRPIRYIHQQHLSGSASALWAAQTAITGGRFLVLHGDDLYGPADLERLLEYPRAFGVATLVNPPLHSFAIESNPDGTLADFREVTADTDRIHVCTGAYVLDQQIFAAQPVRLPNGEFGLPQTVLAQSNDHPTHVVPMNFWLQINTPQQLAEAEARLKHLVHPSV